MSSSLGPASREAAVQAMQSEVLDLLVVGAGATGTGTALDAASRGLSVGLIDKGDIASGTSSKSSQLVHGGLRYLQQGNVALVRESLRERKLLLTTLAPHLVRPLPFMLPLKHRVWERLYVGAGLLAYDVIGGAGAVPRHRHVSKRGAIARFPDLRPDALIGALQYYDAQMDDARLAVAIARTAAREGAHVAPHTSLVGRLSDEPQGVHRVVVRDELSGDEYVVSARNVALCVGVWAPEVSSVFTESDNAVGIIRSKGVHLRLPRSAIDGETALIVPTGQERPVRPALADPLARRDDRHRVDGRPGRRGPDAGGRRVPARPAQRSGPAARHRRRRDLHVRGAAPPRPRPVRRRQHREGDPRAPHRARGAGRAGHRRREVDHVPGDGTRPRRHGAQRVRPAGTAMPYSGPAPGGIGRRDGGRRRGPCGSATPSWPSPWRMHRGTRAPTSRTPARTRAHAASRT